MGSGWGSLISWSPLGGGEFGCIYAMEYEKTNKHALMDSFQIVPVNSDNDYDIASQQTRHRARSSREPRGTAILARQPTLPSPSCNHRYNSLLQEPAEKNLRN
jgi:hypothetical protein